MIVNANNAMVKSIQRFIYFLYIFHDEGSNYILFVKASAEISEGLFYPLRREKTAENANKKNLVTGTRYLNTEGMLPFENMVADYVKETHNHVLYRVTPIFEGNNLLASGVQLEAKSVEDNGDGIQFCVYVYNFQPGILIDYATGKSRLDDGTPIPDNSTENGEKDDTGTGESDEMTYILNTSSKKFHDPACSSVAKIKDSNRGQFTGERAELLSRGYEPCKICNP